ncbi:M3 family metallopeptidase, partial [Francisella tularensis subsp. holarctica]
RDGKVLSSKQIDKLVGTRQIHSALKKVIKLEFGIFDMTIHSKKLTSATEVQKELDRLREHINLIKTPRYNKFQSGF